MIRLTEQAQALVARTLHSGETAVDATAGNGYDTSFLAQTVGPSGCVYAFDVQRAALQQTQALLEARGLHNVVLCEKDHAGMLSVIPERRHGHVGAVMFNLGYLPGGDKRLTTCSASTVTALRAALQLLRPAGVLTVLAYPGHAGGAEETQAVDACLQQLDVYGFQVRTLCAQSPNPAAPRLFVVEKTSC